MSCSIAPDRLQRYLDGGLAGSEAREVEQHVESCAQCQSLEIVEPELRSLLRNKLGHATASAALRARVLDIASGSTDTDTDAAAGPATVVDIRSRWSRRALGSHWTPRLAMVATLLFLLLVPLHLLTQAPALAKTAVERYDCHAPGFGRTMPPCCHDLMLAVGDVLAAPSSGRPIPDLEANGLELVTTTRCNFDNVVVNLMGYQGADSQSFSLYMSDRVTEQFMHLDPETVEGVPEARHRLDDTDVTIWERDGLTYFWVGPHASPKYDAALTALKNGR